MRPTWRIILIYGFGLGLSSAAVPHPARAQGPIGSLGGYGAMAGVPVPSMGANPMAQFPGRFGAAMPSRMGGVGPLSFGTRPSAMSGGNRPAFTLSPMEGGMSTTTGAMGQGFGRRPFRLQPLGPSGGTRVGGGMTPLTGSGGLGVMPPSFGNPFLPPTNLGPPSPAGTGMSM